MINEHIIASMEAMQVLIKNKEVLHSIDALATQIINCFRLGGKLILCGNGGSAADASHIAAEFVGRYKYNRRPLPAIVIGGNIASLTALSNDFGYELAMARELESIAKNGDLLLALSTSGGSKNVIATIETANMIGIKTATITTGACLASMVNIAILLPRWPTSVVQQISMTIAHAICGAVEETLFTKMEVVA